MSLCGGLVGNDSEQQTTVSHDNFSKCLVTYEQFSQNPAIVNDANLVIKINGK